ncbi:DsbA family protein [Nocardia sp. NPDC020380]|uniref:mycothiol-dependent nitroreductase Rv2466c family protein n=1 Tax=Nocardia sp. NPDC020380 TaxID=3364309 RepID=UPI0037B94299
MADIDLYLDPVCPFAWVTSHWLLAAADGTEHRVRLRQMSLAVLNEGHDVDEGHRAMMSRSRRLGRVFAAAGERGGSAAFAALYQAIGTRLHEQGRAVDIDSVGAALTDAGLDPALSQRLDDAGTDTEVARLHHASQDALGGRGGSPIVVVDGHAFLGPVLTENPGAKSGSGLLSAIVTAATTPGFAALHRPYQGPPVIRRTPEADR